MRKNDQLSSYLSQLNNNKIYTSILLIITIFILYYINIFNYNICGYSNEYTILLNKLNKIKENIKDIKIINNNLEKQYELSLTSYTKNCKHYKNSDLESVFGVKYLINNRIEPKYESIIRSHTVKFSDYQYSTSTEIEENIKLLLPYLNTFNHSILESQYYIKYSDDARLFGVFAEYDLKAGTILDEYVGVINIMGQLDTTDYAWTYPLKTMIDDKEDTFGIDSSKEGNAMRFVNHNQKVNVDSMYLPHNNLWRIFYYLVVDVNKDEQFFVSYGNAYWSSRYKPT